MRLADVCIADFARFFKNSAKNCRVFDAEFLKIRRRKRGNSAFKRFSRRSKASARRDKTSAVSKCKFLGCATPNARDQRILRRKVKRFRRRKFKNQRRRCKKSVADRFARALRSSARRENVEMRLADVRAADSARFFHVSAKNCRVFDAEI